MRDVILLGPQRLRPTVRPVRASRAPVGRVCVISAGWQEREGELDELSGHLHRPVHDLGLYRQSEKIFAEDPELFEAVRRRQDDLKEAQGLYRVRLRASLGALRQLGERRSTGALASRERRAALRSLQALDRHHVRTLEEIHATFLDRWRPDQRPAVRRAREHLRNELADAGALLIAGGHVQVLRNRLRLVGLEELLPDIPVIAWSAGAMVLARRVVLFHDRPPHGAGEAEVLDAGLGLAEGLVPLPHARARLDLDDGNRVALFARRFSPAMCVAMDEGAFLAWRDGSWHGVGGCRRLTRDGTLTELED